jgi:hypothetical protein
MLYSQCVVCVVIRSMSTVLATAGVFGGRRAQLPHNGLIVLPTSDLTEWSSWSHEGHRLWALMSDAFWVYVSKVHRYPNHNAHDWTLCSYARRGSVCAAATRVAMPTSRCGVRTTAPRTGVTCTSAPVRCLAACVDSPSATRTESSSCCCTWRATARARASPARRARERSASSRTTPPSSNARMRLSSIKIPMMSSYIQHLTALLPQCPWPCPSQPTHVIVPISILPLPDTVMHTRLGQKLPLYYDSDEGMPSSTTAPDVSVCRLTLSISIGNNTSRSQGSTIILTHHQRWQQTSR